MHMRISEITEDITASQSKEKIMYDYIYRESLRRAKNKVWLISDTQQSDPANAQRCMDFSMADIREMGIPFEQIWYLGDAMHGANLKHLTAMADLQEKALGDLNVPLYYVPGNHDYDYAAGHRDEPPVIPFWEMVRRHPGWYTTEHCDDYWFHTMLGDHSVYFLADHIARDNSWLVTHGWFRYGRSPYTAEDAAVLREKIAGDPHPVITASHYAFLGGNRDFEGPLLNQLLPLGTNHRIHFYGHAHIGDWTWAKKDAYRRICGTDWHDIPQVNVSSLENIRGHKCRSVFLHIYEDGGMGIFFRNHDDRVFTEAYFPSKTNYAPCPDFHGVNPAE